MKNPRNIFAKISAAVVIVLAIGTAAVAKRHSDPAFSNIHIRNFGKMDGRFYRGAQPDESDYKDLKALGIQTVIDLTDHPTSYEKRDVEAQIDDGLNAEDRKSTRLNSSHVAISYAVFCLKKKKQITNH